MMRWRRRRDSNSRMVSHRRFSRPLPSAARPPLRNGEQYKHLCLCCKALIVLFAVKLNASQVNGLIYQRFMGSTWVFSLFLLN